MGLSQKTGRKRPLITGQLTKIRPSAPGNAKDKYDAYAPLCAAGDSSQAGPQVEPGDKCSYVSNGLTRFSL